MPVRKDRHGMPDSLKRPVNGREAALQALLQIWQEGAYTAIALNRTLRRAGLEELDRRFATELVNGAVKAKGTLDFVLGRMTDRPVRKLEPVIYCILHLGLFWLKSSVIKARINLSTGCCGVRSGRKNCCGRKSGTICRCASVTPAGW